MDLFLKECPILLTSAMVGEREREGGGRRRRKKEKGNGTYLHYLVSLV